MQVGEAMGEDDVPDLADGGVEVVAFVEDLRVAVVDLEEFQAAHRHEFLRGDAPAEVGVIDVGEHRLAGGFALGIDRIDIALDDFEHAVAALGLDNFAQVDGAHVDRGEFVFIRELLAGNENETAGFLEFGTELSKRFQAHFWKVIAGALLDPVFAEAFDVTFEDIATAFIRRHEPAVTHLQGVMIAEHQEIVAMLLIPIGDHLGIAIAIAPEGVGVEIALPPAGFLGAGVGGEQHDGEGKQPDGWADWFHERE